MSGNQSQYMEELRVKWHMVNIENAQLKEVSEVLFEFLSQKYLEQLQTQFCNLFLIDSNFLY